MKKLKKPAVLLLLAAVLLSCVPERVQAVSVPEDELPANAEHGTSIFTQENTLHVTYHSNRVEYDHEKVGYNIYLETPCDYCIVQFPSSKEYETQHIQYIVFITRSGTLFDPYRVDGDGGGIGNTSRTAFSSMSGLGNGEETYDCYWSVFIRDDGWFNDKEWPAPRYGHSVISMPSQFEGVDKNSLLYLLGCCEDGEFPDCRISEGDGDNPAQNASGGIPGSESNPILDEEIGTPILSACASRPDVDGNISGNNLEYYDVIEWKKKTSTGYNLLDSGHAVCRLQFKIKPEATFVEGGKSTVLEAESKDFSLGFCNASQLEKRFQYHNLVSKFYGKYMAEHHPATNAQSYELNTVFNYYCRVIVSDSLTVIPTQTTGWKCGKWKRAVVSGNYHDKDYVSDDGEFNENGDWISDGNYENIDNGDAVTNDPANAGIDDIDNGADYGVGDVKGLLSQVGQFPKIIKKLFSFLPEWCLALFAFSFACMGVILVIKAVRG